MFFVLLLIKVMGENMFKIKKISTLILFSLLILNSISTYAKDLSSFYTSASTKYLHYSGINEKIGSVSLLDVNSVKPFKIKGFKTVEEWHYIYKPKYSAVSYYKTTLIVDCNNKQLGSKGFITFYYGASTMYDKNDRIIGSRRSNEITKENESGAPKIFGDNLENPIYHALNKVVCKFN